MTAAIPATSDRLIVDDVVDDAIITNQMAPRIARALEQEIIAAGWPVGQSLGNEEQLVQRFGVSRWVMREALAITERDGLTCMRRGRSGGLFVSAPADSVVATTMRNYLLFAGIDRHELLALRRTIDGIVCRLAAANTDEMALAKAHAAWQQLAEHEDLGDLQSSATIYRHILALANNRLVSIFGEVLSQLTFGMGICLGSKFFVEKKNTQLVRLLGEIRQRQLECVIGADVTGAMQAAGAAYDNILQLFDDSPFAGARFDLGNSIAHTRTIAERIVEAFPSERNIRRVDTLTLQIQLDILRLGYRQGDPIASEKLLVERYEVGRNVLREAIRVLQRDQIVAAAEGRQGGLCVAVPTADNIIRSNLLLFQFVHVQPADVDLVAAELLALAAEVAATRVAKSGVQHLAAVLAHLQAPLKSLLVFKADLLEKLALASDNPVLALLARTVVELQRAAPSLHNEKPHADIAAKLANALCDGDAALSRRYCTFI